MNEMGKILQDNPHAMHSKKPNNVFFDEDTFSPPNEDKIVGVLTFSRQLGKMDKNLRLYTQNDYQPISCQWSQDPYAQRCWFIPTMYYYDRIIPYEYNFDWDESDRGVKLILHHEAVTGWLINLTDYRFLKEEDYPKYKFTDKFSEKKRSIEPDPKFVELNVKHRNRGI